MPEQGVSRDHMWWAGQRALITGAANGIGLAMANAFARRGAAVVLADMNLPGVEAAAKLLEAEGHSAQAVHLDVSDSARWEAVVAELWGDGPINVLCNNAGIGQGDYHAANQAGLADAPVELWDRVIATNLNGAFYGVRAVVGRMVSEGVPGHVVNTASMAGFMAPANLGIYSASKFGVVGMSEALRAELRGFGIGVSVLAPGGVATRFGRKPDAPDPAPGDGPLLMAPESVAERVVEAVQEDHFYVFPHPEYVELVRERTDAVLRDFERPSAQSGYRDPDRTLTRSRNPEYTARAD